MCFVRSLVKEIKHWANALGPPPPFPQKTEFRLTSRVALGNTSKTRKCAMNHFSPT